MDITPLPPLAPPRAVSHRAPRRGRGRIVAAIVVALLVGLLLWLHPWRASKLAPAIGAGAATGRRGGPPGANAPQTVTVATAHLGAIPISLAALGTVTPLTTVTIKSQLSGYLTQIGFSEGQMVHKGDFLAQIDDRAYQAVLEQYQGNLLRDQALLANAQHDLGRYQRLSRQDSISSQNVDTQAAAVAQYQGAVKSDQGQIDGEKLNILYCHIVAPSDGRLGLRQVDVGNYVTPGDATGLVVLTQLQPISVVFTIPQTQLEPVLARIRGQALPVTALATDDTTVLATGMVSTIDNQIDTSTGTVKLRAIFPNSDLTLFPNQFVNTSLLVDTIAGAVLVPDEAVQRGTPGTYVYLVGADKSVSLRPIGIGAAANGQTVVTAGLKIGDTVVVDGTSRLRPGAKIVVAGDHAGPPAQRRSAP